MKNYFDVIVIGGGIIGLSTAYQLLKRNKRVLLIEKNEIGYGASGSCDEMILLQSKKPGILLEMALESLEMYKGLSDELKTDLEFQRRGGMVLIENEEEKKIMESFIKKQREYGVDVEIIGKKELLKKQPFVNERMIGSTFCSMDSQVNPLKVMRGFLSRGIDLGLTIMKRIEIKEIKYTDHWMIYFKNKKYVEAEYIINAAGAWASDIGKMVDINIPIVPKRGQVVVTEKIPQIGQTNVWSARYIARKIKPELFKNEKEDFKKLGIGFALSQTGSGNYFIGSTREYVGYKKETIYEALKIIINQGVHFFPIFKNVHMIRSFAGLRPATQDGKPILDEVKKGYFIVAGHEGDGIALAPITGKLVAQFIEGKKILYDINQLSMKRFEK